MVQQLKFIDTVFITISTKDGGTFVVCCDPDSLDEVVNNYMRDYSDAISSIATHTGKIAYNNGTTA